MSLGVQSWDKMTCAVCAWTMLADSDMSPVYTLPLVLCALVMCYLQVEHPLKDWRMLGEYQKLIRHSPEGGLYVGVAVNSKGLLAVADNANRCIHLLKKDGSLVRDIGKGVLRGDLRGIALDQVGNVWVANTDRNQVLKFSQDGTHLETIKDIAGYNFKEPTSVSVSPEGRIYICDSDNHRVTVQEEEGMFNPLSPEFKIPAEPINAGDKMAAPRREPISLRITLYSPFLQPNRLH